MPHKLSAERAKEYRKFYVGCIDAMIGNNVRDAHFFRHCCDSWFAFEKAGHFVTSRNGKHWRARTFDNPGISRTNLICFQDFDWVSSEAIKLIQHRVNTGKNVTGNLVKDHSVPLDTIRHELEHNREVSLECQLRRIYRVALISKKEHDNQLGKALKNKMPDGWQHDPLNANCLYARYDGRVEPTHNHKMALSELVRQVPRAV